jgi:hypothetical protein
MKKTTLGLITFCLGIFLIYTGTFILKSFENMTISVVDIDKKKYYNNLVSGILLFLVLLVFFLYYLLMMCKGKKKSFGFKFY